MRLCGAVVPESLACLGADTADVAAAAASATAALASDLTTTPAPESDGMWAAAGVVVTPLASDIDDTAADAADAAAAIAAAAADADG